ncbi:MAG TPA: ABC transporter permease [Spirochaetota bacterium]|nr:ABC transporter permease [Spirochaetota bacterium]HOK93481.1 ABC transporter permease [Spirochaetota bacterium]HON15955.1 ABC transporter permease [Spirochaetota bacterium]HPD77572.1 ABC transporter permease [Spirochaetota bacterium]HPP95922.1 ABC transporter permease [Spirochaetota bacterium]
MKKRSRFPFYVTVAILVFFYLPIIIVFMQSFNASRFGGAWKGFTLLWYYRLFADKNIWHALSNTFVIAFGSTFVSIILGTMAAFALYRYKTKLQITHNILIYLPLVIPDILMGISLLLFFVSLRIELSLFTILLSHITFCMSYVAMVVLARFQDFDYSTFEAALDLGATWWIAVKRVLVPYLGPGIAAGGLLAFTLSLDDFVITFFVAGPDSTTLPLYIYSMMRHGSPSVINALSVLMVIFTFIVVFISKKLMEVKE